MPALMEMAGTTLMAAEIAEVPDAVARLLAANAQGAAALGARLRETPPDVVVTCARGSSDHAATYAKYLIETLIGVPVASAAPSIASILAAPVATRRALALAISQSGRSPDLLASAEAQKNAGATLAAFVNDETSPLAAAADVLFALKAGPERSVAATKSCIAAMAGLTQLVAAWSGDEGLAAAVAALPDQLAVAVSQDWSGALEPLEHVERMFVIGRERYHHRAAVRTRQYVHQLVVERAEAGGVVDALARDVEDGSLDMHADRPVDARRHRRVARRHRRRHAVGPVADERRQERGGAIGRVRGTDRADAVDAGVVVEQHAAAAVDLRVDEPGHQPAAGQIDAPPGTVTGIGRDRCEIDDAAVLDHDLDTRPALIARDDASAGETQRRHRVRVTFDRCGGRSGS
jgi:hypothetical protein